MFKKLRLHAVAFGLGLAMLMPTAGFSRDRDDVRREYKHERHEERERTKHFLRHDYYGPNYTVGHRHHGYYDRWGYWHP
jgi:hypothetical protein